MDKDDAVQQSNLASLILEPTLSLTPFHPNE